MADDAWDDWEAAADAGAYDKINKENKRADDLHQSLLRKFDYNGPSIIMTTEDINLPFIPQMKILKRPDNAKQELRRPINSQADAALAKKTLEDREDQYNKARARIFGNSPTITKPMDERVNDYELARARILGNRTRVVESANDRPKPPPRLPSNILREPTAPNGTTGFKINRTNT